jgi:hypothetical protein
MASAEVAPSKVWASMSSWGQSGTCCRCKKEKVVMEYDLVTAEEAQHGKADEKA